MKKSKTAVLFNYGSMIIAVIMLSAYLSGYELPEFFNLISLVFDLLKAVRPVLKK